MSSVSDDPAMEVETDEPLHALIDAITISKGDVAASRGFLQAAEETSVNLINTEYNIASLRAFKKLVRQLVESIEEIDRNVLTGDLAIWLELPTCFKDPTWFGRNTPIFRSPGRTLRQLLLDGPPPTRPQIAVDTRVLEADFRRPYSGQGVYYLNQHLRRLSSSLDYNVHYAPVLPIVQSSGTGKSRTAIELARLQPGLFVCVRQQPKFQQVSEPKRDSWAAHWLTVDDPERAPSPRGDILDIPATDSQQTMEIPIKIMKQDKIAIWLIAVAIEMKAYYTKAWKEMYNVDLQGSIDPARPGSIERWSAFKVRAAEELAPDAKKEESSKSPRSLLERAIHSRAQTLGREYSKAKMDNSDTTPEQRATTSEQRAIFFQLLREVKQSWLELEQILPDKTDDFFHLTIDECGQMGASNLYNLRWLLNYVQPKRSWILLLDTNTRISRLAGTESYNASGRTGNGDLINCEPFTLLPQDIGMISCTQEYLDVCDGKIIMATDRILGYVPKMGRPLWQDEWLKIPGGGESLEFAGLSLQRVVIKLTAQGSKDANGQIALLSQRFPLTLAGFEGGESSGLNDCLLCTNLNKTLAETFVEIHLRRLEKVLPEAGGLVTSAPSEPILRLKSLAAAYHFRLFPRRHWIAAINKLYNNVDMFCLETGRSGEEFTRIMLSLAADGAATGWQDQHRQQNTLSPITVSSWLKALLSKINDEHIGDAKQIYQDLLAWGDGCLINFTHFLTMAKPFNEKKLRHRYLVQAWIRHAAIIGGKNQAGWDILIPVYHTTDMQKPFDVAQVSYITIQVKNGMDRQKSGWDGDFSKNTVASFSTNALYDSPRLFIWIDLQVKDELDVQAFATSSSSTGAKTRSSSSRQAARYNLYVGGHSRNVYAPFKHLVDPETSKPEAERKLASFIGSMADYRSGEQSAQGLLDPKLLKRDLAFQQGLFPCTDDD